MVVIFDIFLWLINSVQFFKNKKQNKRAFFSDMLYTKHIDVWRKERQ